VTFDRNVECDVIDRERKTSTCLHPCTTRTRSAGSFTEPDPRDLRDSCTDNILPNNLSFSYSTNLMKQQASSSLLYTAGPCYNIALALVFPCRGNKCGSRPHIRDLGLIHLDCDNIDMMPCQFDALITTIRTGRREGAEMTILRSWFETYKVELGTPILSPASPAISTSSTTIILPSSFYYSSPDIHTGLNFSVHLKPKF
jgi:hypothetical protein